jgi:hypothetical protein
VKVIAEALALGEVVGVEPVKPDVAWKVTTDLGAFHVKRVPDDDWAGRATAVAASAEVERAAVAAGVEVAEPVALGVRLDGSYVSVHRWVDGRPLRGREDVAAWIGTTMARLHTIPPPPSASDDALVAAYGLQDADDRESWVAEGEAQHQPWAAPARAALDVLHEVDAMIRAALPRERVVGSHRDLHSPNILRRDDGTGFVLVDFEGGGPELAWPEAVRASFEIARLQPGRVDKDFEPDPETVRAVVQAYLDAGGVRGATGPDALIAVLGIMLNRIQWFMWRSLGHRRCTDADRAWATDYIAGGIDKLTRRFRDRERFAALLP